MGHDQIFPCTNGTKAVSNHSPQSSSKKKFTLADHLFVQPDNKVFPCVDPMTPNSVQSDSFVRVERMQCENHPSLTLVHLGSKLRNSLKEYFLELIQTFT